MRAVHGALAITTLVVTATLCRPAAAQAYADRDEVRDFVAEMVKRHGFRSQYLERLFGQARYDPTVVDLMTPPPPEAKSWQNYRATFVSQRRIDGGVDFWRRHSNALKRAASVYGVPPEIVVAIIGVETFYGRNTGDFRVIDSLATLAFDYPRRADFFRAELEQFLLYTRESRLDATSVRGSYAGAIGLPQFMPGSIRRYGVDFDRDGRRDLAGSADDAIGSVANYLKRHGWIAKAPIAVPAAVQGERYRLAADDFEPVYRAGELRNLDVEFDSTIHDDTPAGLVELVSPDVPAEYRVGLENFYVLTRYNRSSFYATAVLELAEAVKAAYQASIHTKATK
jgi:membrane-bound lytic murein transglycosylase B